MSSAQSARENSNYTVYSIMVSLLLLLLFDIAFMQGIYNYIPESNHVFTVYSVSAVL
jgi:hypothetical protein